MIVDIINGDAIRVYSQAGYEKEGLFNHVPPVSVDEGTGWNLLKGVKGKEEELDRTMHASCLRS